ncbi:MAG TPA: ferric reductase-like transmembrane domain-containing protein, partial [Azospirillaceae bacterium]|nr:ferric reductase-like transmembrane domain-containing protein [Azospirillaceae bacterium]
MYPWRDRNGEFSWFKALVFAAALAPAVWLAWRAGWGDLGPRPWTEAIHRSGDWALRFLLLSLAVTPLRLVFRWGRVMTVRRLLGLTALGYALLHLALYVGDMGADLPKVATEIALRVYLTIGFVVVVGLTVLGATSPDAAVRRLGGRRWRAL